MTGRDRGVKEVHAARRKSTFKKFGVFGTSLRWGLFRDMAEEVSVLNLGNEKPVKCVKEKCNII